jgi:hypothetical protein
LALAESILLLVFGGMIGSGGTILTQVLNNRYQTSSNRRAVLQANRDAYATRVRPILARIVAAVQELLVNAHTHSDTSAQLNAPIENELKTFGLQLRAEPDCDVTMVDRLDDARWYSERYRATLTMWQEVCVKHPSLEAQEVDALNTAENYLITALAALLDLAQAQLKLLDTPVS